MTLLTVSSHFALSLKICQNVIVMRLVLSEDKEKNV